MIPLPPPLPINLPWCIASRLNAILVLSSQPDTMVHRIPSGGQAGGSLFPHDSE